MDSQITVEADAPRIQVEVPVEGLMVVRLCAGFDTHDLAAYLERSREIIEAGPYAVVMVCERRMSLVRPSHAAMQAAWIHQHLETIRRNCAGVALVLPNAFLRGATRAVLSMAPMPVEVREIDDEKTALAWCVRALATKRAERYGAGG